MTTVREHLEAIRDNAYNPAPYYHAVAALKDLDESETAWRADGSTYRLVPDKIEVPTPEPEPIRIPSFEESQRGQK